MELGDLFNPEDNVGRILGRAPNKDALGLIEPKLDDLNPVRLELAPNPEEVGWIFELPLLPNAEFRPLDEDFGLENLFPEAVGCICVAPEDDLLPPNLLGLDAGIAVTVGVKSLRVIVAAALWPVCFFFGAKVGLCLEAKGLITGVKVRFLDWNVNRDLTRPLSSSSSFSSVESSSSTFALSLIEPSTTAGVGEIMSVLFTVPSGA